MNRALVIAVVGGIMVAAALAVSIFTLPGSDDGTGRTVKAPAESDANGEAHQRGGLMGLPHAGKNGGGLRAPGSTGRGAVPLFDIVRISPDGNAVIAGRAIPGSKVTVLEGGKPIGTVTADARGEWVLVPAKPLAPGSRTLSLRAKLPDGSTQESKGEVVLVVPKPGYDVAGRKIDGTGGVIALRVPRPGAGSAGPLGSRVLQGPGSARRGKPGSLSVDSIDYDLKGRVRIGGTAHPGARLRIYLDNRVLGDSVADKRGHWSFRPPRPLKPGTYRLRVDELGTSGAVARRIEIPFSRATALAEIPAGGVVVVQPGDNLWQLARGTYGSGFQYTVIYDANKEQIRDPDLIYPGQIFSLPKTGAVN